MSKEIGSDILAKRYQSAYDFAEMINEMHSETNEVLDDLISKQFDQAFKLSYH